MKIAKIDLRAPYAAENFAKSLKETGFAVIVNHGIDPKLLDKVYSQWATFFGNELKHKYLHNTTTQAGFFPFKSENAKGFPVKDLKEFYHLRTEADLPLFSLGGSDTLKLLNDLRWIGRQLLGWLQINLPTDLREELSEPLNFMANNSDKTLFRILHYPPLKFEAEPGAVRAAAHEDINLITLLPAATAPGLEVQDFLGNWIPVDCDPGNIVVNAGDMLQLATDGYYKSTTHRVVNPIGPEADKSRYSMPLFIHPRSEVKLSENKTAEQYLNERLAELGLKEKS